MTHKVHPKIFRIKKVDDWLSRGFFKKNLAKELEEDFKIRKFFKRFADFFIESIEIEKSPNLIKVIINTARPGMLIGRGGEGIEKIRKELIKEILGEEKGKDLKLEVIEIKDPWLKANLVAQWVARQIEKRIPYRKVLKQALQRVFAKQEVKGVKIEVSGRLGGAEIARKEWLKEGKLPRQTIRANIDYGQARAYCTYGVIGVKVWLYKES